MNILHAVVLGALQGFAEVLPISSSAHLILVPWLLRWPESGLTFDVALHLGTFIALTLYFRQDIIGMIAAFFDALTSRSLGTPAKRLPFLIIAATVPAAVVGKLFEHQVEDIFRSNPLYIALALIVFGIILGIVDIAGRKRLALDEIRPVSAMTIGLFQCLALIPGVSRSGITITAGLMLGFTRESAARFSFLLSLPIVAGAALLKTVHLAKHGIPAGEGMPMLVGIAVSAVTGYISVAFLLKYVQKHSISPFVWYRVIAGGSNNFSVIVRIQGVGMSGGIKEWPEDERPREKMLRKGVGSLTNAELLALIIRTGDTATKKSAIDLGRDIISHFGDNLRELGSADLAEICSIKGMGPAKATGIKAAFALASRFQARKLEHSDRFTSPRQVFDYFHHEFRDSRKEYFLTLLLDGKNRIIRRVQVSEGSLNQSIVHPREVFIPAVKESAAAIILVHNHPSGDPAPSSEDIAITRRLREAGDIMGIKVLDHIIVGDGEFTSFVERGLL